MKKIPVTLLTGYLGAGKTTVLNEMVKQVAPERIMVIENEVGKTNVDGALVEQGVEDVIELTAGCLCCSLADGLLDALELVSARRSEFDRLVIETTGVADPSSIVQTFLGMPMVAKYFDLQQVICVTDVEHIEDWLEHTAEALRQLVMSDVIFLHKTDVINPLYLEEVKQKMIDINPNACIYSGNYGHFPFQEILTIHLNDEASFRNQVRMENVGHFNTITKNEEGQRHKISTFTLSFDKPFLLSEDFSLQLYRLVNLYRDQVYRIKGIIEVENYPNKVVLQSVRSSCVISDGAAWVQDEERKSQIVFIGLDLKKEIFQRMFDRYTIKHKYEFS